MNEQIDNKAKQEETESAKKNLEVISDIPLKVVCVLGTAKMTINQLLKLSKGSVIELNKNVGEPVDLFINNKLVAKGEVVIVEDRIGITLTEIMREVENV